MATGHGVAAPADGGVLINTSRMKGVRVDPEARTARVEAGAKWADLVPEAAAHGLAGLQGSTSGVGIVGYTMGGGFGWLGREYRFAADSVKEADVVTADGELVKASAHENADLFWGLEGGGGNFGIVTSLEFALYPITHVFVGNLFYHVEKAEDILDLYARWSEDLPYEVTSSVAFLNVPPMPDIPEPLRGQSVITVRFCYTGEDLEGKGEELLRPWRELGETRIGEPIMDTFGVLPYQMMAYRGDDVRSALGRDHYRGALVRVQIPGRARRRSPPRPVGTRCRASLLGTLRAPHLRSWSARDPPSVWRLNPNMLRFGEDPAHPPNGLFFVPFSAPGPGGTARRYLLSSSFATETRWTSSGPSARRRVLALAQR
jgi:hypothetical protein